MHKTRRQPVRRLAWVSAALTLAAGLGAVSQTPAHAADAGTIYDTIRFSSPGGPWQEWLPPPGQQSIGSIVSYPDVSGDSSGDDVVSVVTTTGWWIVARHPDGSWGPWTHPNAQPPVLPSSTPGTSYQTYSTGNSSGDTDFFQIDGNNLYESTWYPDGIISSWVNTTSLPAGTSSIAVTTAGTGANTTLQAMALDPSGYMYHNIWTQARQWQGWQQPAQLPPGGPEGTALSIAAAGMTNGDAQFIAIGRDGDIYHNIREANGNWQGWAEPLQPPSGWFSNYSNTRISAAADYDGNAQFLIWDFNISSGVTTLYHDIRYSNGQWQDGWREPPSPPADLRCGGSVAITTFYPDNTDLHVDGLCF